MKLDTVYITLNEIIFFFKRMKLFMQICRALLILVNAKKQWSNIWTNIYIIKRSKDLFFRNSISTFFFKAIKLLHTCEWLCFIFDNQNLLFRLVIWLLLFCQEKRLYWTINYRTLQKYAWEISFEEFKYIFFFWTTCI